MTEKTSAAEPLQATVVIPTHDHWYTLRYAIESARRQTLKEIEILVVGDGVPDQTRELLRELLAEEPRLLFFDHPKGERHGERYRARALETARGRIVCYLSDDDLWLPDHLETMAGLLERSDFAAGLAAYLDGGGGIHFYLEDLSLPFYKTLILGGENRVPLSCGGHTLARYRALRQGWAPAPLELPTDLYMWQQFLGDEGCRATSARCPTVLHFPSPLRRHLTPEQRVLELRRWSARLEETELRGQLIAGLFEAGRRGWSEAEIGLRRAEQERKELEELLEQAFGTATWRLREWLIRVPVLGPLLRRLVSAAARRVAP